MQLDLKEVEELAKVALYPRAQAPAATTSSQASTELQRRETDATGTRRARHHG